MYFRCSTKGITPEQATVLGVIDNLYRDQSMTCWVKSLEPITIEVKAQLNDTMRDRLIVKRIPAVLPGYVGRVEDSAIVISPEETEPAKPRRARKGNADIRTSENV